MKSTHVEIILLKIQINSQLGMGTKKQQEIPADQKRPTV